MRINKPRKIEFISCLKCDKCGIEKTTISFYLQYKSDHMPHGKGFYPDLAVRLCKKCAEEIYNLFEKEK